MGVIPPLPLGSYRITTYGYIAFGLAEFLDKRDRGIELKLKHLTHRKPEAEGLSEKGIKGLLVAA